MAHDRERTEKVAAVMQQLHADGVQPVWVDRAPVFDKVTLLHALYQALQLPAWFGFNWDALEECLRDIASDKDVPHVLVFNDFELLEERDPETAETFLDIIRTISSQPASRLRGIVRVPSILAE